MSDKIVIVQPPCGSIKGITETSPLGYEYANFYDIPYAKPPLGPLRFKDPEPLQSWSYLYDASKIYTNTLEAQALNEDCLKLNVYTKNARLLRSLHPVMIFIPGGFFLRSPNHKSVYGPEFLLQKDVILVTIKYRAGALGFLSSDDPKIEVPGNAGLKDQVMAMRWVQKNIAAFGGDPRNVTLFGFSAGGASVHYHMMSPLSKDLFHKAIMMSGTAFYVRGFMPKLHWATRLARKLGWQGKDNEEASAFEFLRGIDVSTIKANEETILTDEEKQNGLPSIYGPTLEAYKSRMCIIPEHPDEMMKHAWSHSLPLMIGGTQDEGLMFYKDAKENPNVWRIINKNPSKLLPYNLTQNPDKRKLYGDRMKLFYFGREEAKVEDLESYIFLQSDTSYWFAIYKALMGRLMYPEVGVKGPTWLYNFAYESKEWYKYRTSVPLRGLPGVAHADDTLLLLSNDVGFGIPRVNTLEYDMMQLMVDIYTSFASNGNPNNERLAKIMGKWEPVSCLFPLSCCNIANPPEVVELPEKWRVIFWDTLYKVSKEETFEHKVLERPLQKSLTLNSINRKNLQQTESYHTEHENLNRKVNLLIFLLFISVFLTASLICFLFFIFS